MVQRIKMALSSTPGDSCSSPIPDLSLLPFTRTMDQAMFICKSLNASLFVLNSAGKLSALKQYLSNKKGLIWTGFRTNGTTEQFLSVSDQSSFPSNITGWAWGEPNGAGGGYENCLALDMSSWLLSDVDCKANLLAVCDMSNSSTSTVLHFRGVENVSQFLDTQYIFIAAQGERSYFLGLSNTRIVYMQGIWVIENITNGEQLGSCNSSFEFPLGVCNWTFSDGSSAALNLHACQDNEFACMDSQCLPQEKKCNQELDCTYVNSDEEDCELLIIPESYNRDNPPATSKTGQAVEVTMDIVIIGLLNIEMNNELFTVKFNVDLAWSDHRLTMINLLEDQNANSIDQTVWANIWVPTLFFQNSKEGILSSMIPNDAVSSVFIQRKGQPYIDDRRLLQQNFVYSGNKQIIMKKSSYTVDFICEIDLVWYPLDSQFCKINITILSTLNNISINPGAFIFQADPGISSFNMNNFSNVTTTDHDHQMVVLSLQLDRQPGPVLMSSVLPTMILTLINQITNYYLGPEMFEAIIAMNATVLMTLSSIFISYFQNLPTSNSVR